MKQKLQKKTEYEYILPKHDDMKVDCLIIANDFILNQLEDEAIDQLTNCSKLPGVVQPVCGMPDMHWGYGEPMGAVSAFDEKDGIISVGMVGFDINCGINLIRTNLKEVPIKQLIPKLFENIPCGVGSKGKLRITEEELDKVLKEGCEWCIENGYGTKQDIENTEENGKMEGADPEKVSQKAKKRGKPQLGTLGAGNHFLEIQKVDKIYDKELGKKYKLEEGDICIMLHCGSRGLGHQIATDYLKIHKEASEKYNIKLPDQQLVCAPIKSKEGQDYYAAMKCAVNYAFANRLVMTHWIRETFEQVMKKPWKEMEMETVYGIAHNIAKMEKHKGKNLMVHRKGATRSYPNTPVIVAGSMGTASYLLEGTQKAMEKTFGSTCHGAGRVMSRKKAIASQRGQEVQRALLQKGIIAKSTTPKVLAEEAPEAYKNVDEVIESVAGAGISKKVARLIPLGVVKG